MKVYFLRHGIADPEQWHGSDFDRPLTDEGRKCVKREAKALASLDLGIDAILTSPLVRAKQTAEILAKRLDMQAVDDERLRPGFDRGRLAEILQERAAAQSIVLVGHEPDFSHTVGALIGGAAIDLKKGGIACVEIAHSSAQTGRLVWLIPPKILIA